MERRKLAKDSKGREITFEASTEKFYINNISYRNTVDHIHHLDLEGELAWYTPLAQEWFYTRLESILEHESKGLPGRVSAGRAENARPRGTSFFELFRIAFVATLVLVTGMMCQTPDKQRRVESTSSEAPVSNTTTETAPPQSVAAGVDAVTANKATPVLATAGGESIGTLPAGASIFYSGDAGKFYEVNLYPGRPARFVRKSDTTHQTVTPVMPEEQLSRNAYAAVINGEMKAIKERPVEAKPSEAARIRKDLQMDRYVLKGLNDLGVSPLDADLACNRGMEEDWPPH